MPECPRRLNLLNAFLTHSLTISMKLFTNSWNLSIYRYIIVHIECVCVCVVNDCHMFQFQDFQQQQPTANRTGTNKTDRKQLICKFWISLNGRTLVSELVSRIFFVRCINVCLTFWILSDFYHQKKIVFFKCIEYRHLFISEIRVVNIFFMNSADMMMMTLIDLSFSPSLSLFSFCSQKWWCRFPLCFCVTWW